MKIETTILNKLQDLEKERIAIQHCENIINNYITYSKDESNKNHFITNGIIIEKNVLCDLINRLIKVFEKNIIIVNSEIKIENGKSQEYTYITIE